MTSSISSAICHYKSAHTEYSLMAYDYRVWIHSLYAGMVCFLKDPHATGAISPSMCLWLFQTQLMPTATSGMEYNLEEENSALEVSNGIRSLISQTQNNFNTCVGTIEQTHGITANAIAAAQRLSQDLKSISNLIKNHSLTVVMGASNVQDLLGFLSTLKANVYGSAITVNNPSHVVCRGVTHLSFYTRAVTLYTYVSFPINHTEPKGVTYMRWPTFGNFPWCRNVCINHYTTQRKGIYTNLKSNINQAMNNGISPSEIFTNVQSSFSNLNQSVSGVSSFIQSQMQYLNQNLQQYFSVYNNFFSDYNTLNSYIVSKSVGS